MSSKIFFRKRLGTRALTPLAATVLLLGFSLALGIVILNFGQNLIQEKSAEPTIVDGQRACPVGCVAEELFTNPDSPLISEMRSEAR